MPYLIKTDPSQGGLPTGYSTLPTGAAQTLLFVVLAFLGTGVPASGEEARVPLTGVRQVRLMARANALGDQSVHLRGVVTFADQRGYFLFDAGESIAVRAPGVSPRARPGDLVEVWGRSAQAGSTVEIVAAEVRRLGTASVGPPLKATFDQLASSAFESQWVQISGIVRAATLDQGSTAVEVAVSGGRVLVRTPFLQPEEAIRLVDASVTVRGNWSAIFNERKQWMGVRLYVPDAGNLNVDESPLPDPFAAPLHRIAEIQGLTFAPGEAHRVRIRGTVTYRAPSEELAYPAGDLAIVDETQSTFVRMRELPAVRPGDLLDIVGFVGPGNYTKILEDAVIRRVSSSSLPPARLVTIPQILAGNYDASLIQVDGQLIGTMKHGTRRVLAFVSGADLFRADIDSPADLSALDDLRPGSILRLTGVCIIAADALRVPKGFRMMLRTPADIAVVSSAPWLTRQRTVWALALLAITVIGALAWILGLKKIVKKQTEIIRTTLESTADAILVTSIDRKVLMLNRKCADMLGAHRGIGNPVDYGRLIEVLKSQVAGPDDTVARIQQLGDTRQIADDRMVFLDGRIVESHSEPLQIGSRVVGRVWAFRDVTARERTDLELRRSKEKAEAASRFKSDFLANTSHEIRTPMNGICGMIGLVLETALTGEQREFLEIAEQSAESLLVVINDILDLSKVEAGKLKVEAEPFPVRDTVLAALKPLAFTAKQKGIELRATISPDTPHLIVGDRGRLRQILVNLVGNGVKFTSRGHVLVTVKPESIIGDEVELHIAVTDTGIGIPPEKLGQIFKPFEQAGNTNGRVFGGTGLGLTISRRLAELMNGALSVESQLNVGSAFHLSIKCAIGKEPQPDAERPNASAKRPGVPRRILLAEDDPVNQRVAQAILLRAGHTVSTVASGQEVVEAWERERFDIILMDVEMPGMDGHAATKLIRQRECECGERVPIIALTARAMEQDRRACLDAGMDGYLPKPIEKQSILAVVERAGSQFSPGQPSDRLFAGAGSSRIGDGPAVDVI